MKDKATPSGVRLQGYRDSIAFHEEVLPACKLPTPFQKNVDFNLNKERTKMKATLLVVLLLFLFACLVELWKGENFQKVTLGNSYWTRESQYDIGVGSTNETNNFTVFFIRNPLAGAGPHPDSDFNGGNNLSTPA